MTGKLAITKLDQPSLKGLESSTTYRQDNIYINTRHTLQSIVSQVGLDLALVLRNLGIINDFELFQKRSRLRKGDMLWPRGQEPEDMIDVKLYMQTHLRLKLR